MVGSLEVGKAADLLVLRPAASISPILTAPVRNLVPNLVYSARGDEVSTVIVDGRSVRAAAAQPAAQLPAQLPPSCRPAGPLCRSVLLQPSLPASCRPAAGLGSRGPL